LGVYKDWGGHSKRKEGQYRGKNIIGVQSVGIGSFPDIKSGRKVGGKGDKLHGGRGETILYARLAEKRRGTSCLERKEGIVSTQ